MPLRYLSTYFEYLMCSFVGLLLNHNNLIAANTMSCLVPIVADECPDYKLVICLGVDGYQSF